MAAGPHLGKCVPEKQTSEWPFLRSTQTHTRVHTHTPKNPDDAHVPRVKWLRLTVDTA